MKLIRDPFVRALLLALFFLFFPCSRVGLWFRQQEFQRDSRQLNGLRQGLSKAQFARRAASVNPKDFPRA